MEKSPSRGHLLRETNRWCTEIHEQYDREVLSRAELNKAQAAKAQALDAIACVEGELAAAAATRAAEAATGGELAVLQGAVGSLSVRLQDLARGVKAARARRDAAREGALCAHYLRRGLELEVTRAASGAVGCQAFELSGSAPVWGARAAGALERAAALWRRVSDAGAVARDVAEGALQVRGLTALGDGGGEGGAPEGAAGAQGGGALASLRLAASAPAAGLLYGALGAPAVAADAKKALAELAKLNADVAELGARVAGAEAAGGAGAEGGDEDAGGEDDGEALEALRAALRALAQNVELQRCLLQGALEAVAEGGAPAET